MSVTYAQLFLTVLPVFLLIGIGAVVSLGSILVGRIFSHPHASRYGAMGVLRQCSEFAANWGQSPNSLRRVAAHPAGRSA